MSTWETLAREWVHSRRVYLSAGSSALYLRTLRAAGHGMRKAPGEISADDLDMIAMRMGETMSTRTVDTAMTIVYSFAKAQGCTAQWERKHLESNVPNPPSSDLLLKMLGMIPEETRADIRDRAILKLLYMGGLRVSEICNLRLEDVTGDTLAVRGKGAECRDGVTQISRFLPGEPFYESLKAWILGARCSYMPADDCPYVFIGQGGYPMKRTGIWRIVKERGEAAGIKGLHPHTLRHACATHLLNRGASLAMIQSLLGHHSITTTQIYTHVAIEHLAKAVKKAHPHFAA
jgi:site-specific recombinase XerD